MTTPVLIVQRTSVTFPDQLIFQFLLNRKWVIDLTLLTAKVGFCGDFDKTKDLLPALCRQQVLPAV